MSMGPRYGSDNRTAIHLLIYMCASVRLVLHISFFDEFVRQIPQRVPDVIHNENPPGGILDEFFR